MRLVDSSNVVVTISHKTEDKTSWTPWSSFQILKIGGQFWIFHSEGSIHATIEH